MQDTAAAARPEKASILIVDDLPEKHVVFRSILEELGQHIVSARSGKEALAQILDNEFAVILLDVNMPDIDGLETASLIRQYKRSAQTPIVFITAYVDELQAKRGYALGAVDYIPSPVVPEVLRSKVRVFVELFRMNRQLQWRAAEREALARSEAARAAAEQAIARADYLADASQLLSRSLDMDQTARALLEVSVPMLGRRALLVVAGSDGAVMRSQDHPAGAVGGVDGLEPGLREAVARVLEERRFERWQDGTAGAAVCPLLMGEHSRGVLVLLGRPDEFDSPRLALAKEVVSRASIALENARLYAAVQEADRRKNEFLAMLAHELRNPLAPIRNAVHIMQGADVAPPTMNWARDVISRQADHMARLIDDLLDVSRIVQGKVVVKPEKLSLASLVERSVESSMPKIEGRSQRLAVELPDDPVVLDGDSVRLAQVLSNLINNASKFSPPDTRIALRARYAAGKVTIAVQDQGVGIAPDFLPHIFDLFAQADQSLDRSQGGLGIGLTLVKHLVELHGGRVEARSEGIGRGTEVSVQLPASLAPAQRPAEPVAAAAKPSAGERAAPRVLVVDDLAASAETLMMLLEMEGFEVKTAHEGNSALAVAEAFRPDVVLLDIGLPGMNGFEVAHRLRSLPASRDALLIALTGYGEAESRNRSAEAGFDFHMVKPADVNLLLQLVADPQQARRAKVA
ncbi:hybrid sensor histidine kinase/response regulator [Ramlibacter tataouinensis]|uniref:histidine kinase n=1 Tax=Ramlibacter tataouinensis (strain ATCC BAA-407 / DSM 14655 / LMG 21543 / TTB310) TaxID=365046 RepID=F5XX95_RAMTT|nr:response regulator [Ramlibacter tataouinensis]AEG93039.1 candidate histidine kinase, atypical hybrid [Ramlibacter tataouinensis TTB310]